MNQCSMPLECTTCNDSKDNCLANLGCKRKRMLEDWKPNSNERVAPIQDGNENFPWNDERVATFKDLLDDILVKRAKNSQH